MKKFIAIFAFIFLSMNVNAMLLELLDYTTVTITVIEERYSSLSGRYTEVNTYDCYIGVNKPSSRVILIPMTLTVTSIPHTWGSGGDKIAKLSVIKMSSKNLDTDEFIEMIYKSEGLFMLIEGEYISCNDIYLE